MKRLFLILVTAAMTQMLPSLASAEDSKPNATLNLSQGQVGLGVGWSWGKGTLNFRGKNYTFKVTGLSVGDVGITKARASGKVYNLKNLSDFNGTNASAAAEATLAKGGGATVMKNENGVEIRMYPKTKGVNLKLAGEGVKFTLTSK